MSDCAEQQNQNDHGRPSGGELNSALERLAIPERLKSQLAFIRQLDALKSIWRRTLLLDGSRTENDAEHTWEMATMALVLAEYGPPDLDLLKVLKMILIHDIVEIDAGDAYAYDGASNIGQKEREEAAAARIFGLLPAPTAGEFSALWREFEDKVSSEAKFARAMDSLQPLLHSYQTNGRVWSERGISASSVRARMACIHEASSQLGDLSESIVSNAIDRGFLISEGSAPAN